MGERKGLGEKTAQEIVRRGDEDSRRGERLRRSRFGRLLLEMSRRVADENWRPDLDEHEQVQFSARVERITWMPGIIPGRLFLTNHRLIFRPILQPLWLSVSVELSRNATIWARRGRFLSRGIHMWWPWLRFGHLPGFFHVANLKVGQGRKAFWFRVEDPGRWEGEMSSHAL